MIAWLKQLANWIGRNFLWLFCDPWKFWMAVSVIPAAIFVACLLVQEWEPRIRISGMFLQLFGLATVAWGLRDTRKLFKQPSLQTVAVLWLQRRPSFYRHFHIVAGTGHFNLSGATLSGFGNLRASLEASLEERVAILESHLNEINSALANTRKRVDEETRQREDALEAERRERSTADESTTKLLEEAMAGGLLLEMIGVIWLFFGIFLASASTEIARWL